MNVYSATINKLIIVCNSIHIYLYSAFHDTLLQSSFTENEHFYITFSSLQHNLRYQTGTQGDAKRPLNELP